MIGTEKVTKVVAVCSILQCGLYVAVDPREEEVRGSAQHNNVITVWEDVSQEYFT